MRVRGFLKTMVDGLNIANKFTKTINGKIINSIKKTNKNTTKVNR